MSTDTTLAEKLIARDTAATFLCLILLTLLSWVYLSVLVTRMETGDMSLMGMGSMSMMTGPMQWQPVTFVLMLLMWWVMMIGMMLPSAAPMILLFARVHRKNLPLENSVVNISLFSLAYLVIWLVFSIVATVLQWQLGELGLLSIMMMKSTSVTLGAVLFAVAGIYQFTPLKKACLKHCQSPLDYLSRHWRKGKHGAFTMGLVHGAYCVGCCWCLMLLLFVGGVMNLLWIGVIAIFVLLEKLLPLAGIPTALSGAGLLVVSGFMLSM